VADDDAFSLDFTQPGADNVPTAAPDIVPPESPSFALELVDVNAPPSIAVTPPLAAEPPPPYPAALLEAAQLHSEGKSIEAMRRLEQAIKSREDLGDGALAVWGGLFDLLQCLGREAAFYSLAVAFTRHFDRSPPMWVEIIGDPRPDDAATQRAIPFNGALNAGIASALKQASVLAQTQEVVRIDLDGLTSADNNGGMLMMRLLAAMKKAKKHVAFVHPEPLAAVLQGMIATGKRENPQLWLLLLELYQQMGAQDPYEETAINYAVTFEISPPAWVTPEAPSQPDATTARAPLRGMLTAVAEESLRPLESLLSGIAPVEIDGRDWQGIDAASAAKLLALLKPHTEQGRVIRLSGLSPLVAASLYTQGFAGVVELHTRPI
jgi:anti-anti-sigma regulatory factor